MQNPWPHPRVTELESVIEQDPWGMNASQSLQNEPGQ